jgi:hypothetical protein
MAKGQRRSNREVKKPKQPKSEKKAVGTLLPAAPERILGRGPISREAPRR